MSTIRVTLTLATALFLTAPALPAQEAHQEFARQSQLLEQDLNDYLAAREREKSDVQTLRDLNRQLGRVFADPNASVSEMRRLEGQIASATDQAFRSLKETARARSLMYDQMDRLAGLARQMEERPPAPIDDDNPEGLWEFRLDPIAVHALVDLQFQTGGVESGYVAVGTYRSSTGRRGTLRGTVVGDRLQLEVMDSRVGKVATLDGTIGYQGRLQGTWSALEIGLGRDLPSRGSWSGHRVASESEVKLD